MFCHNSRDFYDVASNHSRRRSNRLEISTIQRANPKDPLTLDHSMIRRSAPTTVDKDAGVSRNNVIQHLQLRKDAKSRGRTVCDHPI